VNTKSEIRNPREARGWKSETAGYMLVECLVYISVLMILMGLGFAAFYSCWDKSKSLRYHADDIARALHTGDRSRADIRQATGRITVEATPNGQRLQIPHGTDAVDYEFAAGQLRRRFSPGGDWTTVLPKVRTSDMRPDPRTHVTAWRWDVELVPTRPQVRVPPMFAFEAVPPVAP